MVHRPAPADAMSYYLTLQGGLQSVRNIRGTAAHSNAKGAHNNVTAVHNSTIEASTPTAPAGAMHDSVVCAADAVSAIDCVKF